MGKDTNGANEYSHILTELNGGQALRVLYALLQKGGTFATAIMEEAKKVVFRPIQVEAVANMICATLNSIPVEDCWDNAARQSEGYRDITEVAFDMMEEALHEFVLEVEKYHRLGKCNLEALYIQGFLLGLYTFDMDPETDFYSLIEDYICDLAVELVTGWIKQHPTLIAEREVLTTFIDNSCPNWEFLHSSNLEYQEEADES